MDLMRLDAGEAEESLSYLQFQSSLLYTDRTYDNKERRRGEDSGGKGEQGRGFKKKRVLLSAQATITERLPRKGGAEVFGSQ
ncbi:hypothetical protein H671_6g16934 [Cricetulus griseus]|nr:hypothetical protein H671_6g16934 [Cricetulus griseus]